MSSVSSGGEIGADRPSVPSEGFGSEMRWVGTATHHLHEEAAGLADATGGAENRDLVAAGLVSKSLGDGARGGAEEGSHRC